MSRSVQLVYLDCWWMTMHLCILVVLETVSKPMKSLIMMGIQVVIAIRLLHKRERWITRNQNTDQYP